MKIDIFTFPSRTMGTRGKLRDFKMLLKLFR